MISASAGAFARPSLLSQADNCPHLNHRPTIGSNWHIALAVLGEIWGCIRPRTGCPFHQLESCLLVGRGRGGGLPHCYLVSWSKWFVEIPSLSLLVSSSPPASLSLSIFLSFSLSLCLSPPPPLSPLRYYCLWTAGESLQSRTPTGDWQPYSSSQWDIHIRGALTARLC